MPDRIPCEFFLVRYVPDVVKGEFVNIGVIMRMADRSTPTQVRFTRDWTRVLCMDAGADTGLLEELEQEFQARLLRGVTRQEPKELLDLIEDSFSNSLQLTKPRVSLAENQATEMEQLMRMYVEPMAQPKATSRTRKLTGRSAIQATLRTNFERAGVWALMTRRVAASRYTRPGDPLRIDCGYQTKAAGVRMFQAVSLEGPLEMAYALATSADALRAGVLSKDGAPLNLTAVVEPLRAVAKEAGEDEDRYHFCVATMEERAIRVVTVNDLARVAATARHDLGL
jgi:hypothetical protein